MIKFIVDTEAEKQQLLEASEHIHNQRGLDTDLPMVNTIAHLYQAPHLIVVKQPAPSDDRRVCSDCSGWGCDKCD